MKLSSLAMSLSKFLKILLKKLQSNPQGLSLKAFICFPFFLFVNRSIQKCQIFMGKDTSIDVVFMLNKIFKLDKNEHN